MIRLLNCTRVRMHDVKLLNPASWTSEWRYCNDVVVDGISISSRANSNGDGLDFDGCSKVRVSNSTFDTSDDSICLQTSLVEKPCRDIAVNNCQFASRWAGMRIGLLSRGDFENVVVNNCTFRDHNDSGLKIRMNEGGEMSNMVFSNLVMRNVPRPVFLTFCQENVKFDAPRELPPMKRVHDLQFNNIVVDTDSGKKGAAFIITGMPGHDIENISFSNIQANFPGGGTDEDAKTTLAEFTPENLNGRWPEYGGLRGTVPASGFYARHVSGITLRNIKLSTKTPDARPPVVLVDAKRVVSSDSPTPDQR